MTKENIINSHKLINSIYNGCFNTENAGDNLIDLESTEEKLKQFRNEYFPNKNDWDFDPVEESIREIYLDEREHAFEVGFVAGLSLLSEVLTKEM